MRVPLVDLGRQYATIREEVAQAVADVFESQRFIGGPVVERFERRFASYLGVRHAISVSSGTDALLASLMALEVGPGDEVICPTFTFAAPAQAIARTGATPVFVDVDPDTFNLAPDEVEKAASPRTRGVIAVHLFGQCADLSTLSKLCHAHDWFLLEDAAQATGARHAGRRAGTIGTAGCFSFFPAKNLGAAGDGGLVATDDDALAERLRMIRHHGARPKYVHHLIGGNFRLDAVQAAVLDVKLDHLEGWNARRREHAAAYDEALAHFAPVIGRDNWHVYNQYVVRCPQRGRVREALAQAGIDTAVYYPLPMHRQPCFSNLEAGSRAYPVAEQLADEVLALPVFAELSEDERAHVIASFLEQVAKGASG